MIFPDEHIGPREHASDGPWSPVVMRRHTTTETKARTLKLGARRLAVQAPRQHRLRSGAPSVGVLTLRREGRGLHFGVEVGPLGEYENRRAFGMNLV